MTEEEIDGMNKEIRINEAKEGVLKQAEILVGADQEHSSRPSEIVDFHHLALRVAALKQLGWKAKE